jgi:hypothetical protein
VRGGTWYFRLPLSRTIGGVIVHVHGPGKRRGFAERRRELGPRTKGSDSARRLLGAPTKAGEAHVIRRDDAIFEARRAACRDALVECGMPPGEAERWCATWEAEAARQGVVRGPYYWDAGRGWIDAQLAFRNGLRVVSMVPGVERLALS